MVEREFELEGKVEEVQMEQVMELQSPLAGFLFATQLKPEMHHSLPSSVCETNYHGNHYKRAIFLREPS